MEGWELEAAFLKKLLSSLTVNLALLFFFIMYFKMNVACHHIQGCFSNLPTTVIEGFSQNGLDFVDYFLH